MSFQRFIGLSLGERVPDAKTIWLFKDTITQKESNRRKSKIRCRIEHVFGFITVSMHGLTVRSIGIKRAEFNIGLTNLVYNFCRYTILKQKEVYMG